MSGWCVGLRLKLELKVMAVVKFEFENFEVL